MKRKSWICFLVMCLTLLITTGCDTNREEDVNEGGINDNIICFSELFKDDVIVYTGFHKGDAPIGKDSEISLMKIFTFIILYIINKIQSKRELLFSKKHSNNTTSELLMII